MHLILEGYCGTLEEVENPGSWSLVFDSQEEAEFVIEILRELIDEKKNNAYTPRDN